MYSHNPQTVDNVFGVSVSLLGVIATLFLGFLAIFGEWIKDIIFKPDLQPADKPIRTKQLIPVKKPDGLIYHEKFLYQRLPIKNIRKAAKEVRVLLTYTKTVENFIPIPLNWTHWNRSTRDISRGETAYLDILRKGADQNNYEFCWAFDTGIPVEPLLRDFNPKLDILRLQFFEHDRSLCDIFLRYLVTEDCLEIIADPRV